MDNAESSVFRPEHPVLDDYGIWFPDEPEETPYDQLKQMQEILNEGLPRGERWTVDGERSLLAMHRKNDPFYSGQPSQVEKARWFARVFNKVTGPGGLRGRVTLRQVHYIACGEEADPITGERLVEDKPDGTPYLNTDEDYAELMEWSKWARNMGLVDPSRIYSRRGSRDLHGPTSPPDAPFVHVVTEPSVELPAHGSGDASVERGVVGVLGYSYWTNRSALQPSLVEVWAEKWLDSEDVPVIADVCRQEGVNLIVGTGFMTISGVYAMLERRAALHKPLRILYLSDFDPAGRFIALHPARIVEFAIRRMDPRPDIRLKPLALHREQVEALMLPRLPIKRSDLRRRAFEARHGEGAVELNALTMGEERVGFARSLLRRAIRELRDPDLSQKVRHAEEEAEHIVRQEHGRRLRWVHRANDTIADRAKSTAQRLRSEQAEERRDIQRRLRALQARRGELDEVIDRELAPLAERAERVRQAARLKMEGFEDDFEPVAESENPEDGKVAIPSLEDLAQEPEGVADGWAYDSRRGYLEQLDMYKERR